ncbi:ImmA/IrrE family metallo-endopeptidase [Rhodococcoides corynebacterioides]|uniref:ImmA/IrrE family metallo-endopeptidase n=1 Tax=Rhodococcoides corynebacterioides TaxID=53972 RepID=UPI001C9AC562|nr:ImmA/IrrE family metallo-endopeptidase [Rhodococcus corynebacterioides]MBY6349839.1 ImmA/IrrE family metallo-endopeptidase [Rhodococcus corynebacterioides]
MTHSHQPSVLTSLRAVIPQRDADFLEALRTAEIQASKLIDLVGDERGVLEHHLTNLPRIVVIRESIPVSGMSYWNGQHWVIVLASHEPAVRQRFTLMHEFKHIIDHGNAHRLYRSTSKVTAAEQAEAAADYFAGCTLVSKRSLKAAWGSGMQRVADLASHFGVSEPAIRVRLAQTGLDKTDDVPVPRRCARPVRTAASQHQRFIRAPRSTYRRSYV